MGARICRSANKTQKCAPAAMNTTQQRARACVRPSMSHIANSEKKMRHGAHRARPQQQRRRRRRRRQGRRRRLRRRRRRRRGRRLGWLARVRAVRPLSVAAAARLVLVDHKPPSSVDAAERSGRKRARVRGARARRAATCSSGRTSKREGRRMDEDDGGGGGGGGGDDDDDDGRATRSSVKRTAMRNTRAHVTRIKRATVFTKRHRHRRPSPPPLSPPSRPAADERDNDDRRC